jgi:hypothetical protein
MNDVGLETDTGIVMVVTMSPLLGIVSPFPADYGSGYEKETLYTHPRLV